MAADPTTASRHVIVQLRVATRSHGVRVEVLRVRRAMLERCTTRSEGLLLYAVLRPGADGVFASAEADICVTAWGATHCTLAGVRSAKKRPRSGSGSKAAIGGYDGGTSDQEEEEEPAVPRLLTRRKRKRGHNKAPLPPQGEKKRRRRRRRPLRGGALLRLAAAPPSSSPPPLVVGGLRLAMTDTDPDELQYIWLTVLGDAQRDARMLPHPPHPFRIENTCGACIAPCGLALQLNELTLLFAPQPPCIGSRRCATTPPPSPSNNNGGGELITTLAGTFAPCTNRMQVDFRGVRSVRDMHTDWHLISGLPPSDTTITTVYMVVLKGCVGLPVLLFDHGRATPPSSSSTTTSMRLFDNTPHTVPPCFLAAHLVPHFCLDYAQHSDVCQAIELKHIQWDRFLPPPAANDEAAQRHHATLLSSRASAHVSRRGGVMLRLLFPRQTRWDEATEAATVLACDHFLQLLRHVLQGRGPLVLLLPTLGFVMQSRRDTEAETP